MQAGAQAKASESPSALVAQGVSNGVNAVMGAGSGRPPAAGSDAVLVSSTTGLGSPVTGGTSPNATLASGNSGDTGSNATGNGSDDVNLASPDRTNHILNGNATGGGHLWPGANVFATPRFQLRTDAGRQIRHGAALRWITYREPRNHR